MKRTRTGKLRMILAGVLALAMLPLSGCSQQQEEETDKINVAVIIKDKTSTYWSPVEQACKDLEEEFGSVVEITYMGPEGESTEKQIALVEEAIKNQVDAIVIAACSTTEENDVLEKAVNANIPVITIDSDVTYEGRSAYIGTMNLTAGKNAARYAADLINDEGTIGIIYHGSASTATERREGFVEQLEGGEKEPEKALAAGAGAKQNNSVHDDTATTETNPDGTPVEAPPKEPEKKSAYSNIRIAEILDGESKWDVSKEQAMKLIKDDKVDLIFATNRKGTWGACEAVSELIESGEIKEGAVKIVGFDNFENEGKSAQTYLSKGILNTVIVQNPYNMGYLGVRYALEAANGDVIPSQVDTGAIFVTSDNVNDADIQFLINN